MNTRLLLIGVVFFLSFFRITVEGLGALIFLDIVCVLYFAAYPGKLRRFSFYFLYLGLALASLTAGYLVTKANEFSFIARLFLVVLNALFLVSVVNNPRRRQVPIRDDQIILMALVGYMASAAIWSIYPEGADPIFYFNSIKPWVATFPALLMVYLILRKKDRAAVAVGVVLILVSYSPDISSRTLLLQSVLLTIFALWRINKKIAIFATFAALPLGYVLSSLIFDFVEKHDHSNTFRMVMIAQILDFSTVELLIGRGLDAWRFRAFSDLIDMPGAEAFFETANPHFFPAELMIRGGVTLFFSVFILLFKPLFRSSNGWIGLIMLMGTFLTTNTGVERLYITLVIYLTCTQLRKPYVGGLPALKRLRIRPAELNSVASNRSA